MKMMEDKMVEDRNEIFELFRGEVNPLFFKDEIFCKINTFLENFTTEGIQISISNNGNHIKISYPLVELNEDTDYPSISHLISKIILLRNCAN